MSPTPNVQPDKEGVYRVKPGRHLYWVMPDTSVVPWAPGGSYVDVRSAWLSQFVQMTSQMHKLVKVDTVPADARVIGWQDAPASVKAELRRYHARDGVVGLDEIAAEEIPLDSLPDASPAPKPEPEPEETEPKEAAPEPEPDPPAAKPRGRSGRGS